MSKGKALFWTIIIMVLIILSLVLSVMFEAFYIIFGSLLCIIGLLVLAKSIYCDFIN